MEKTQNLPLFRLGSGHTFLLDAYPTVKSVLTPFKYYKLAAVVVLHTVFAVVC